MKKARSITILKANGQKDRFSVDKLANSLRRSGASEGEVSKICYAIEEKLYPGMPTKKIYRLAFNLLKENSRHLAAKYHLKKGIMELGPSGYPFEKFVGELLKHKNYKVKTSQIVQGKCVKHEVDVVAVRDKEMIMIECKYHNLPGTVCDVKIPLYIQARFKDIESVWKSVPAFANRNFFGWVVTNTRFSTDAIQYGRCAGVQLLGWDYPNKGSLKDLIDNFCLYPLTCLTTLSKSEKQILLDAGLVLCKDLLKEDPLNRLGLSPQRKQLIKSELEELTRFSGHDMEIPFETLLCQGYQ